MCKITEEVWREFEKLVYAIIKDTLNLDDSNSISEVTEKRNDGGYDGVFIIPIDRKKTAQYKILFEAKLRKDIQKDLPLQDFSKALIIAINTNADTLIIGTNLHLSENSKKQLSIYSYKTGLAIKLLDGIYIDNWLKKQIHDDDNIDSELHNLLKRALSGTEGTDLVGGAFVSVTGSGSRRSRCLSRTAHRRWPRADIGNSPCRCRRNFAADGRLSSVRLCTVPGADGGCRAGSL